MESDTAHEEIAELKKYLKEHPIDHKYDELAEMFDCDREVPLEQSMSRMCYELLKEAGEIDDDGNVKE